MFDKIFTPAILRKIYSSGPGRPLTQMPPPPRIEKSHRASGRSLYDGAARGWGLQFGPLYKEVCRDPLFREARKLAGEFTLIDAYRQANIFLLIRFYLDKLASRNIVELGTWKGGNLFFMARVLREIDPSATVFGLDTFAGMPETIHDLDLHRGGDFSDVDMKTIENYASKHSLTNIKLVKGDVRSTLEELCRSTTLGLAHIDLDIYEPIAFAQHVLSSKMVPRGYLVYDDATVSSCPGATLAIEEMIAGKNARSEQIWPHFVFRAGFENE